MRVRRHYVDVIGKNVSSFRRDVSNPFDHSVIEAQMIDAYESDLLSAVVDDKRSRFGGIVHPG